MKKFSHNFFYTNSFSELSKLMNYFSQSKQTRSIWFGKEQEISQSLSSDIYLPLFILWEIPIECWPNGTTVYTYDQLLGDET